MAGKWMTFPGKPNVKVRHCDDGQWEMKKTTDVRTSLARNKRLQRVTKKKPSALDTKGALGQMTAIYPEDVAADIHRECGHDQDKQNRWLRDHPQWLTAPASELGVPPKRQMCLVGAGVSSREWERIFGPGRGTRGTE